MTEPVLSIGGDPLYLLPDASAKHLVAGAKVPGTSDDVIPGTRLAQISGTPVDFNGLFEIGEIPTPLTVTYDAFVGLPTPPSIGTLDMAEGNLTAESLEGRRTVLRDVSFQSTGVFAGSTNYTVTDDFGLATVRVQTSFHPVVGTAIPVGRVNLTGIFSQFDGSVPRTGGYQFLLSSPDDIQSIPEPASILLLGLACVGVKSSTRPAARPKGGGKVTHSAE